MLYIERAKAKRNPVAPNVPVIMYLITITVTVVVDFLTAQVITEAMYSSLWLSYLSLKERLA